ncbi:TELO2-interacting protein 2 [Orussus abietinus]|uniref:TELO2-interacting protein 2 n=1 Tax=Orussus abietinus TaxID=222816 RepID=UPI00062536D2|nr:TELO2-interacting protein 2 [Orussus abietinus]
MNDLLRELEALKITGNIKDEALWTKSIQLIEKTFVPQKSCELNRSYEEKDFREYRLEVDRNLRNVRSILQHVLHNWNTCNTRAALEDLKFKTFCVDLIILIGEQSEKSLWNSAESVSIANELAADVCNLLGCENLSQALTGQDDKLTAALLTLRPKLLKDTWKTYPAAVTCYKWMLYQVEVPILSNYLNAIIPTALIIFDDYELQNRVKGLESIHRILQHCSTTRILIDTGYAEVLFSALEKLTHQREVAYVVPLYSCLAMLLAIMEFYDNSTNTFSWSKRDNILCTLLDNMECEQRFELRHAYMLSLPQLLTHIGCAKWCDKLIRILSEYCEHHTDLRTLKATLETAKVILLMFHPRVPAHCNALYSTFLRLHFDLTETPVLDSEITQTLEECVFMLYKLTPTVGGAIMRDDRMRSIIKNSLQVVCLGDSKYLN